MESDQGDYILAPAYDLMCTALHIDDSSLALRDGLYQDDTAEASYQNFGTYTKQSFIIFAEKAGLPKAMASTIVDEVIKGTLKATELVERSFLSEEAKRKFVNVIEERRRRLLLQ